MNQKLTIQYLTDILKCANEIESFVSTGSGTCEDFTKNKMLYIATERCFSIISEATSRIKKVNTQIEIKNNLELIALINQNYYEITPKAVWDITQKDIKNLKIEVQDIISSLKN